MQKPTCILFAMIPPIAAESAGGLCVLNRAALADHPCGRYPDPHETFFMSRAAAAPGQRAVVTGGGLRLRHWQPIPEEIRTGQLADDHSPSTSMRCLIRQSIDALVTARPDFPERWS